MSPYSTIVNRKYQHQVADSPIRVPRRQLVGTHVNGEESQNWSIVSVGGDKITIWNAFDRSYAFPPVESPGAPLLTGPPPYQWHQLSDVVGGWYRIATEDKRFVWRLTSGQDGAPIELVDASYKGEDAQWGYNPSK